MDEKVPQTMVTDLDMGLREAMMSVLPNTKQAFSTWHIMSKLPSWFSTILGSRYETFASEFHRVYALESENDFVHQWGQMINEFGLGSDRHVAILSYHREYWALPFLRGWFFGGLLTTGFSLSIKAFFKGFLISQTRLKDFVEQVFFFPTVILKLSYFLLMLFFAPSRNIFIFFFPCFFEGNGRN